MTIKTILQDIATVMQYKNNYDFYWWQGFPGGSDDKESAKQEMQEMWVRPLGQEDLLEEGMATHASVLAWRISWTVEPGRPEFIGLQRVGLDWIDWTHTHHWWQSHRFCSYYVTLLMYMIEGNAKFWLRGSENKDVTFFHPSSWTSPRLSSICGPLGLFGIYARIFDLFWSRTYCNARSLSCASCSFLQTLTADLLYARQFPTLYVT